MRPFGSHVSYNLGGNFAVEAGVVRHRAAASVAQQEADGSEDARLLHEHSAYAAPRGAAPACHEDGTDPYGAGQGNRVKHPEGHGIKLDV